MTRSPSYGGAVLLALGPSTVDVADRALVVAALPAAPLDEVMGLAGRATADGADVVEVAAHDPGAVVEAVVAVRGQVQAGVAVAVRTPAAAVARAAFDAGAVLAVDPGGLGDEGYRAAVGETGASVVAAVPVPADDPAGAVPVLRAAVARITAAGVPAHHFAVEPVPSGGDDDGVVRLGRGLGCAGAPVLVSCARPGAAGTDGGAVAGFLSVAVVRGAGLVRVGPADVRAARRVVDVVGAVRRGRP